MIAWFFYKNLWVWDWFSVDEGSRENGFPCSLENYFSCWQCCVEASTRTNMTSWGQDLGVTVHLNFLLRNAVTCYKIKKQRDIKILIEGKCVCGYGGEWVVPRIRGINIILLTKSSSEIRTSAFNSLFFLQRTLGCIQIMVL